MHEELPFPQRQQQINVRSFLLRLSSVYEHEREIKENKEIN